MTQSRRFGAEGIRRQLRSADGAGAVPYEGPTLSDLWTTYGALAAQWWDASAGVNTGAGTWTDRASGLVLSSSGGAALSASTVGNGDAVTIASPPSATLATSVQTLALAPFRVFVAGSIVDSGGSGNYLFFHGSDGFGEQAMLRGQGSDPLAYLIGLDESYIAGTATFANGSPHVWRHEYAGGAETHSLRFDGASAGTLDEVGPPTWAATDSLFWLGHAGTVAVTFKIALAARFLHGSLSGAQATALEADLLTLMGL